MGVLMKKRLLSYIDYVTKEVEREDLDKAAFREQLLIQIHFFQHERLVHLIVTVTFALLFMMTVGLFFITEMMSLLLLGGLFLVLLIPYISHYYLDLYTHPFIYYKSGIFNKKDKSTYKYNGLHQGYEYLIDLYFINKRQNLAYYKFKPHKFLFNKINISKELSRLIDNNFDETYHLKNTASYYKKSLNDMYLFYKYINSLIKRILNN